MIPLFDSYIDVFDGIGGSPFDFHIINIPANTLIDNGDKLIGKFVFESFGNGTLYIYINGIQISLPVITVVNYPCDMDITIIKTNSSTIRVSIGWRGGLYNVTEDVGPIDLLNDPLEIKISGGDEGYVPNTITSKLGYIYYLPTS